MKVHHLKHGNRPLVAALVALALLGTACGDDESDTNGSSGQPGPPAPAADGSEPAEPGTYAVTQITETFVDESRPTEAPDPAGNAPTRTLETTIVYPEEEGPFPLIVLAHGQTGHPSKLSQLMSAWA